MALADCTCELNHYLHALNLAFDVFVKVFLFDFGEAKEMHRARVSSRRILGNERSKRLIQVFR
jgi:hypothetical protein